MKHIGLLASREQLVKTLFLVFSWAVLLKAKQQAVSCSVVKVCAIKFCTMPEVLQSLLTHFFTVSHIYTTSNHIKPEEDNSSFSLLMFSWCVYRFHDNHSLKDHRKPGWDLKHAVVLCVVEWNPAGTISQTSSTSSQICPPLATSLLAKSQMKTVF